MSSTTDNNKNTTPASTDASNNKDANPTPSDATNNQNATPTPSNNPSPPTDDDNDLTAEPELIEASEAYEKYTIILNNNAMPLPEELEQNGRSSTKVGVPQQISRSMEETRKDFRRKFGWRGSGERSPPVKREMDGDDEDDGEGGGKKGGEKVKKD
ncbi:hypothetical protein M409DRAFT_60743 [Zasmidium cellare ATCC 36951]|uniref:Uncharacterized protein n=1 Tax=Zasmidium cellare ATCC 36951 TaxID=1080233 RepID=A0A6A6C059_ZASCE|nr:uncharacterized protein M409DRAFT_60743 [Zasmidium cellare ATCC 36951]KAF2159530.1 hypothetical protein M409DRAFT_60743 [Zasmidium cellare ATCC 36951]